MQDTLHCPEKIPRDHLEPEPLFTVSQWADSHRILTKWTSAEPGPWRTDRTPFAREPMDAFSDPDVEHITLRAGTQMLKTEFELNCIGYCIDIEPAPLMVVVPRDEDAKDWAAERVRPMIESCPALMAHMTGKEDDLAGKNYKLDRMRIRFSGSNSHADLSGRPCRYVLFDETDKYPPFGGQHTDPFKLGVERTTTFWNRKIVDVSSPTLASGYITQNYEAGDRRRFWVPCPLCNAYQPLVFRPEEGPGRGWLRYPDGATADDIIRDRLAWYECGYCHGRIEELKKGDMVAAGVWCPEGVTVTDSGALKGRVKHTLHRSYHISALYAPWSMRSWSRIAAEWVESTTPSARMNFINNILAEPWVEKVHVTKEYHLQKRCGIYALGEVPEPARVLTAGVDKQLDHYWYVIRAWGIGQQSWLIRNGRVETETELLKALIHTQYQQVNGGPLRVQLACVDSGYKSEEVYLLSRKHPDVLRPIKAWDHLPGAPLRASLLDKTASGKSIPGGLTLWHLDTNYYKDKVNRLIHTLPGEPAEWHLPKESDVSEDYILHMTSEHKIIVRNKKTGKSIESWEKVSEHRANHSWDCEVYAAAAADMLRVFSLEEGPPKVEVYQPRRGGWLDGPRHESGDRGDRGRGQGRGSWFRR